MLFIKKIQIVIKDQTHFWEIGAKQEWDNIIIHKTPEYNLFNSILWFKSPHQTL